jgi:hypothetical protein
MHRLLRLVAKLLVLLAHLLIINDYLWRWYRCALNTHLRLSTAILLQVHNCRLILPASVDGYPKIIILIHAIHLNSFNTCHIFKGFDLLIVQSTAAHLGQKAFICDAIGPANSMLNRVLITQRGTPIVELDRNGAVLGLS